MLFSFSFSFAALSATLARITTFLPRRSKLAETALIAMAGLAEPGLAGAVALAFRVPSGSVRCRPLGSRLQPGVGGALPGRHTFGLASPSRSGIEKRRPPERTYDRCDPRTVLDREGGKA
jgi:hypothetical protein